MAPAGDDGELPERGRLDAERIEAPHVSRRVDAMQQHGGGRLGRGEPRDDIELRGHPFSLEMVE